MKKLLLSLLCLLAVCASATAETLTFDSKNVSTLTSGFSGQYSAQESGKGTNNNLENAGFKIKGYFALSNANATKGYIQCNNSQNWSIVLTENKNNATIKSIKYTSSTDVSSGNAKKFSVYSFDDNSILPSSIGSTSEFSTEEMTKIGDYYPNKSGQTIDIKTTDPSAKYFLITRANTTSGAYYFKEIVIEYETGDPMTLSINNLGENNTFTIDPKDQMEKLLYSVSDPNDTTKEITLTNFNVSFSGTDASLFSFDKELNTIEVNTLLSEPGTYTATATATASADGYQDATASFTVSLTIPEKPQMFLTIDNLENNTLILKDPTAPIEEVSYSLKDADDIDIATDSIFEITFDPADSIFHFDEKDNTIYVDPLPTIPGTYTVTANAYAIADGYQDARASFTVSLTIPDTRTPLYVSAPVSFDINYVNPAEVKFAPVAFIDEQLENESDQTVTWTASVANEEIASVAADGTITPNAIGETTVTVTYTAPEGYRAVPETFDFTINVIDNRQQLVIENVPESIEFTLPDSESFAPVVKAGEETITEGFEWTYSYEPAGVISIEGNTINGIKAGETTVTATVAGNSYKTASVSFSVKVNPDPIAPKYVSDFITKDNLGISTTDDTYSNWSYTSSVTGIKYDAQAATRKADLSLFAIRSNNNNSGIVVAQNPKECIFDHAIITFGSGNTEGRTVDFYYKTDKDEAFEITDMYGDTSPCSKLNSSGAVLPSDINNPVTFTVSSDKDNKQFIGIRSKNGAILIKSIELVWVMPHEVEIADIQDLSTDHIATVNCDNRSHTGNAYTISLDNDKFVANDEHMQVLDAEIVPLFEPQTWTEEMEADHDVYHHLFYVAPEFNPANDLQNDHFDFKASLAGLYGLKFTVNDNYKKSHKIVNADENGAKIVPFTINPIFNETNMKFYDSFIGGEEVLVLNDGKWCFTVDSENNLRNLKNVMVHIGYGGELFYKVTRKSTNVAPEDGVDNVNALYAPAKRVAAAPEGYEDYSLYNANGINLENAESLDMIARVNGALSNPVHISIDGDNVTTAVDNIAAEDAAPEFYTIDGVRINAPSAPGLYIVRKNGKGSVIRIR